MSVPTEVVVTIITVFGGGVISLLLALMKIVLKVNEAVNERHKKTTDSGEIPPKLFDMVYESNQLIKDANKNLEELTKKCNTIESKLNNEVYPRLQNVETRQNFFVQVLNELRKQKRQTDISFADELPEGEE